MRLGPLGLGILYTAYAPALAVGRSRALRPAGLYGPFPALSTPRPWNGRPVVRPCGHPSQMGDVRGAHPAPKWTHGPKETGFGPFGYWFHPRPVISVTGLFISGGGGLRLAPQRGHLRFQQRPRRRRTLGVSRRRLWFVRLVLPRRVPIGGMASRTRSRLRGPAPLPSVPTSVTSQPSAKVIFRFIHASRIPLSGPFRGVLNYANFGAFSCRIMWLMLLCVFRPLSSVTISPRLGVHPKPPRPSQKPRRGLRPSSRKNERHPVPDFKRLHTSANGGGGGQRE